jgi:hypothetical protein
MTSTKTQTLNTTTLNSSYLPSAQRRTFSALPAPVLVDLSGRTIVVARRRIHSAHSKPRHAPATDLPRPIPRPSDCPCRYAPPAQRLATASHNGPSRLTPPNRLNTSRLTLPRLLPSEPADFPRLPSSPHSDYPHPSPSAPSSATTRAQAFPCSAYRLTPPSHINPWRLTTSTPAIPRLDLSTYHSSPPRAEPSLADLPYRVLTPHTDLPWRVVTAHTDLPRLLQPYQANSTSRYCPTETLDNVCHIGYTMEVPSGTANDREGNGNAEYQVGMLVV